MRVVINETPVFFLTWIRLTCDTISGMAIGKGTITELRLEAGGLSGRIHCPPGLRPAPGQYLAATSLDYSQPLPVMLFPIATSGEDVFVAPPLPPTWVTGMQLNLRGPLGKGFHLPPTARRIALASLEGAPSRLIALVPQGLAQQAAVAIYAPEIPAGLPEDVEVLPLDLLPEALAWADFLALDTPLLRLAELRARLGLKPFQRPGCQIQVLVVTDMPCSGLADCGVCAVATQHGWALACSDGPVFDFNQLESA